MEYHWVLAHRYYSSSLLVPSQCEGQDKEVVEKKERWLKLLFWSVSVLIAVSFLFVFFTGADNYTYAPWFYPLFSLSVICILIIVTVMILALVKIRNTIKASPFLRVQINLGRMVAHALAYILYFASWLLTFILPEALLYLMWLIVAIFGNASFFCFFLICWHLGTNRE